MFLNRLTPLLFCAALAGGLAGTAVAQGQPPAGASSAFRGVTTLSTAWSDLTPAQRTALAPLSRKWGQLSEAQQRKWIALAENFNRMPPAEQAKLHSRMAEWVALSPQQRAQARLNFGEAQQLPADDRKAKWEAYQALPPEEKRRLATDAAAKPPATAAAVKPVPADKLANVPKGRPGEAAKPARIQVGPAGEAPAGPPGNPGAGGAR